MDRKHSSDCFSKSTQLACGLTQEMVVAGIDYLYATLDCLDAALIQIGRPRMAQLVELANLSSMIGNLLVLGIIRNSDGVFDRAGPHKYQDLRATGRHSDHRHIEVKVSLEKNNPKGHLPKPGDYLTCRYVLGDENGSFDPSQRVGVVWIWEVRFGCLDIQHFNPSNTKGDSGKTAPMNASGMDALKIVFFDERFCPYGPRSKHRPKVW